MFENLRAFVFIIFLASIVFSLFGKVLKSEFDMAQFKRWRSIWFICLAILFLSNNYWLYIIVSGLFIYKISKKESNKTALFILLLTMVQPMSGDIPGFGVMNYLFTMTHPRMLSLVILLPFYFSSRSSTSTFPIGKATSDKFFILFILLATFLQVRGTTFTDSLRNSFSFFFLDMFLPYFVASRGLKSISDIKTAFTALTLVSFIAAVLGIFEWAKSWVLFDALPKALGTLNFSAYMFRGGRLRAASSLGHPIVFGLFLAASFGAFMLVSHTLKNKFFHRAGLVTLISGLFVTGSRGPWLGGMFFGGIFAISAHKPGKRVVYFVVTLLLAIGLLAVVPGGDKYYNMLPFIGHAETENVEYRQRLFTNSMIVISHYPLFGSVNFMDTPEMQSMIQGEGIIDLVNSYLEIALMYGYVGVGLFTFTFLSILFGIYSNMKRLPDKAGEAYLVGRCLLGSLSSILFTITTSSLVLVIPNFLFLMAGIGAAYIEILRRESLTRKMESLNRSLPPH